MNRILRNLDFWQAKLDVLRKAVQEAPRDRWLDDRGKPSGPCTWLRYSLSRLNRGLVTHGAELAPLLVPSVSYFLEKHVGVVLDPDITSYAVLMELSTRVHNSSALAEARRRHARGERDRRGPVGAHLPGVNLLAYVAFTRSQLATSQVGSINQAGRSESNLSRPLPVYPEGNQMGSVRYLCVCGQFLLVRGMNCPYCRRFERGDPVRQVTGSPRDLEEADARRARSESRRRARGGRRRR